MPPASIPDYLALVGDASDGYPGRLASMGREVGTAAVPGGEEVRSPRRRISPADWRTDVGRERDATRAALAQTLEQVQRERAMLFRRSRHSSGGHPAVRRLSDLSCSGKDRRRHSAPLYAGRSKRRFAPRTAGSERTPDLPQKARRRRVFGRLSSSRGLRPSDGGMETDPCCARRAYTARWHARPFDRRRQAETSPAAGR